MDQQALFESGVSRVSLTRLCSEIARHLARIGTVAVEGEVVRPTTRSSGWTYFTLADRVARLPVAVPAVQSRRCVGVEHGARVLVTGSVVFSARNGQLTLEAEEIQPVGAGAIEAAIARVRQILRAEGVLDRPRRPLPLLPRRVGVVCGAEAAVIGDIESVVADRFPGYPLEYRKVPVSGPGAAGAICGALHSLASVTDIEVVIVARGGGDPASLFPFSAEEVCRTIAGMPVPVVTAIGHERDRPLCDEVSDIACNTPSLAAIRVVPDEAELRHAGAVLVGEARAFLGTFIAAGKSELVHAPPRDFLNTRVQQTGRHLEALSATLAALSPERVQQTGRHLEALSATLAALNPERVLARGYAVVRKVAGDVVRSPDDVVEGEGVTITVAGGSFGAVVTPMEGSPA